MKTFTLTRGEVKVICDGIDADINVLKAFLYDAEQHTPKAASKYRRRIKYLERFKHKFQ